MQESGQVAVFRGTRIPFEIREFPLISIFFTISDCTELTSSKKNKNDMDKNLNIAISYT